MIFFAEISINAQAKAAIGTVMPICTMKSKVLFKIPVTWAGSRLGSDNPTKSVWR